MPWITPKTDWTSTDYFNTVDINRVENNTQDLRSFFILIYIPMKELTFITNRTIQDYDKVSSINRLESNIEYLCSRLIVPSTWYQKTWTYTTYFSYEDTNRWEQTLELLYNYANLALQGYRYCGTFSSGQEGILP